MLRSNRHRRRRAFLFLGPHALVTAIRFSGARSWNSFIRRLTRVLAPDRSHVAGSRASLGFLVLEDRVHPGGLLPNTGDHDLHRFGLDASERPVSGYRKTDAAGVNAAYAPIASRYENLGTATGARTGAPSQPAGIGFQSIDPDRLAHTFATYADDCADTVSYVAGLNIKEESARIIPNDSSSAEISRTSIDATWGNQEASPFQDFLAGDPLLDAFARTARNRSGNRGASEAPELDKWAGGEAADQGASHGLGDSSRIQANGGSQSEVNDNPMGNGGLSFSQPPMPTAGPAPGQTPAESSTPLSSAPGTILQPPESHSTGLSDPPASRTGPSKAGEAISRGGQLASGINSANLVIQGNGANQGSSSLASGAIHTFATGAADPGQLSSHGTFITTSSAGQAPGHNAESYSRSADLGAARADNAAGSATTLRRRNDTLTASMSAESSPDSGASQGNSSLTNHAYSVSAHFLDPFDYTDTSHGTANFSMLATGSDDLGSFILSQSGSISFTWSDTGNDFGDSWTYDVTGTVTVIFTRPTVADVRQTIPVSIHQTGDQSGSPLGFDLNTYSRLDLLSANPSFQFTVNTQGDEVDDFHLTGATAGGNGTSATFDLQVSTTASFTAVDTGSVAMLGSILDHPVITSFHDNFTTNAPITLTYSLHEDGQTVSDLNNSTFSLDDTAHANITLTNEGALNLANGNITGSQTLTADSTGGETFDLSSQGTLGPTGSSSSYNETDHASLTFTTANTIHVTVGGTSASPTYDIIGDYQDQDNGTETYNDHQSSSTFSSDDTITSTFQDAASGSIEDLNGVVSGSGNFSAGSNGVETYHYSGNVYYNNPGGSGHTIDSSNLNSTFASSASGNLSVAGSEASSIIASAYEYEQSASGTQTSSWSDSGASANPGSSRTYFNSGNSSLTYSDSDSGSVIDDGQGNQTAADAFLDSATSSSTSTSHDQVIVTQNGSTTTTMSDCTSAFTEVAQDQGSVQVVAGSNPSLSGTDLYSNTQTRSDSTQLQIIGTLPGGRSFQETDNSGVASERSQLSTFTLTADGHQAGQDTFHTHVEDIKGGRVNESGPIPPPPGNEDRDAEGGGSGGSGPPVSPGTYTFKKIVGVTTLYDDLVSDGWSQDSSGHQSAVMTQTTSSNRQVKNEEEYHDTGTNSEAGTTFTNDRSASVNYIVDEVYTASLTFPNGTMNLGTSAYGVTGTVSDVKNSSEHGASSTHFHKDTLRTNTNGEGTQTVTTDTADQVDERGYSDTALDTSLWSNGATTGASSGESHTSGSTTATQCRDSTITTAAVTITGGASASLTSQFTSARTYFPGGTSQFAGSQSGSAGVRFSSASSNGPVSLVSTSAIQYCEQAAGTSASDGTITYSSYTSNSASVRTLESQNPTDGHVWYRGTQNIDVTGGGSSYTITLSGSWSWNVEALQSADTISTGPTTVTNAWPGNNTPQLIVTPPPAMWQPVGNSPQEIARIAQNLLSLIQGFDKGALSILVQPFDSAAVGLAPSLEALAHPPTDGSNQALPTAVSEMSLTARFETVIQRAAAKLPAAVGEKLVSALSGYVLGLLVGAAVGQFTGVPGMVIDAILLGLGAYYIGSATLDVAEKIGLFFFLTVNANSQLDLDAAATALADAAATIGIIVGTVGVAKVARALRGSGKTRVTAANPIGCFFPGTPIDTEFGHKRIEDIQTRDRVWAFDLASGQWQLRRVTETYENNYFGDMVETVVEGERIQSTYHHPVWVVEGEDLQVRPCPDHIKEAETTEAKVPGRWVDAGDLRVDDVVLLKSGRTSRIQSQSIRRAEGKVYNFQVDELHNYAVGRCSMLAHNSTPCALESSGLRPYQVGRFNELAKMSKVGDKIDLHHVGQAAVFEKIVPGYSRNTGPTIALPEAVHEILPSIRGQTTLTARQVLARDVWNLRKYTLAPNSSLLELIRLNLQLYSGAF